MITGDYFFGVKCLYSNVFCNFAAERKNIMEYRERIADKMLREKLEAMGAVLIEGPKACGKTTTAEQQAKSIIYG